MNFAILADHRVKEREKPGKNLELERQLKKL